MVTGAGSRRLDPAKQGYPAAANRSLIETGNPGGGGTSHPGGAVPPSAPPRMISGAVHGTFAGLHRGVALMDEVGLVEPASEITDADG